MSWATAVVFIYNMLFEVCFLLVIVVLHKLLQLLDIPH